MALLFIGGFPALVFGLTRWAAWRDDGSRGTGLLVGLGDHTRGALSRWAMASYLSAVVATLILVFANIDGPLQTYLQTNDVLPSELSLNVLVVGNFWHFIAAVVVYLRGRRRDPWLAGAGVAAFQALAVVFVVVGVLKALTGRMPPDHYFNGQPIDMFFQTTMDPAEFAFDFWNHSLQDGRFMWPSGHTAGAVAFASALVAYAREHRWLVWVTYPIAAVTALAMVDGDYHWFSDVIAGALIAHPIAWTIGSRVRQNPRYSPS